MNALASMGIAWAMAMGGASSLQMVSRARRLHHLRRLKASRSDLVAFGHVLDEFPGFEPGQVLAAYVWVQQLVALHDVPLHLDDDLAACLRVDSQAVAQRIDAAHTRLGRELDGGLALHQPLHTVRDLLTGVLAAGYEAYPKPAPAPLPPGRARESNGH